MNTTMALPTLVTNVLDNHGESLQQLAQLAHLKLGEDAKPFRVVGCCGLKTPSEEVKPSDKLYFHTGNNSCHAMARGLQDVQARRRTVRSCQVRFCGENIYFEKVLFAL